jgi:iron complex transport system permease protein
LLLIAVIVSVAVGPTGMSLNYLPRAISTAIWGGTSVADEQARLVLIDVRLPRTLLAAFVGGALAVAGALMQGLFRNPLADPGLIGVSAGAALGAVTTIAFAGSFAAPWVMVFGLYALPAAAFLGGLATTVILLMVARRHGTTAVSTLLLAGIAVGAVSGAVMGLIAYVSNDRELRDITLWTLGSLTGASWKKVAGVIPFAILIAVMLPGLVRALNGLLLGEAEAFHLGINLERAKVKIVLLTAAAVGAAVAVAGMIGFVGIVVPHVVRLIAGPDHRIVLPASALLGAVLVIFADIVARIIVSPAELPIGIILAIIGAPVFLHLVIRRGGALGGT